MPTQPAVAIGIAGDPVVMLAAIGAGGQMLAPILDPAHRMAAAAWRASQGRLLPAAECPCSRSRRRHRARSPAPGPRRARGSRQARCARYAASGRPSRASAARAAVPNRDHAAPFDRRHALPRGADFARHLDRRVEAFSMLTSTKVSRKTLSPQCSCTSARTRRARRQHVVHGRKFLEIEIDAAATSSASARVGATHMATSSPT